MKPLLAITLLLAGREMDARTVAAAGSGLLIRRVLGSRLASILLMALLLSGCATHKPVIKPGHDFQHPALTPLGKGTCHIGILWFFHSYGWHNCKNEVQPVKVTP